MTTGKHRCLSAGILFADVGCVPISHCPVPGELVQTEGVVLTLGGCASPVALNLSRLDVPTGLCGSIGDDSFSAFVVRSLDAPFVDVSGLRRISNSYPGISLIINVTGEDRRFVSTTGANGHFSIADIPQDWADEAEVLYLGGYLMMPELEKPETADFLRRFQARGGKTILDLVLYGNRPYWDVIRPLLPYVDYFTPNDDEGLAVSGKSDPVDQAKFFLDAGAGCVVVTCGEKGSLYYSAAEKFRTGIFKTEFIGGTGSGDAFAAGFIAGLLAGDDPYALMSRASAQGMSCVRHVSATGSVFTKAESEAFLAENRLEYQQI
ncbi:MAG: carbohydrate kinase family protein [Thermoguttaceae bacterium]|nr:carbohydrate kinase family protein [Thermoguttaceae bacterium]